MTFHELKEYCQTKAGAYEVTPFGPFPVCFKVAGRIFLEWYPDQRITLRCEPMLADFYRRTYPGTVVVGYHCPDVQKPYKNTVYLDQGLEEGLVYDMIDHSYAEAVKRLRKKDRDRL